MQPFFWRQVPIEEPDIADSVKVAVNGAESDAEEGKFLWCLTVILVVINIGMSLMGLIQYKIILNWANLVTY